jgi:hypothetical protein
MKAHHLRRKVSVVKFHKVLLHIINIDGRGYRRHGVFILAKNQGFLYGKKTNPKSRIKIWPQFDSWETNKAPPVHQKDIDMKKVLMIGLVILLVVSSAATAFSQTGCPVNPSDPRTVAADYWALGWPWFTYSLVSPDCLNMNFVYSPDNLMVYSSTDPINYWFSVNNSGDLLLSREDSFFSIGDAYAYMDLHLDSPLVFGKSPMFVGNNWITNSTGTIYGRVGGTSKPPVPVTVSMNVFVEIQETVTLPYTGEPVQTYRLHYVVYVTSYGYTVASTYKAWFEPNGGMIWQNSLPPVSEYFSWSLLPSWSGIFSPGWGGAAKTNVLRACDMFYNRFWDVPLGHYAADSIERITTSGISGGCSTNPPLFCPDERITRGQMAVFLVTSLGQSPKSCTGRFADVPVEHVFCGFIEKLADLGITGGCGGSNFCPDDSVTRGQMAVFIEAALGNVPNTCSGSRFTDVTVSTVGGFCGFIEKLAEDGVTGGCTSTTFCPNDPVTRGQMAVFLVAAPSPLLP